jgi:NADH dehydrogenase (ubiquinone) Fe-S protein 3
MFKNIKTTNWLYLYTIFKFQPLFIQNIRWLRKILGSWISSITVDQYVLDIIVNKDYFKNVLLFLQKHTNTQFEVLSDLVCVDFPGNKKRFELTYVLLSIRYAFRLRLRLYTEVLTPVISVTDMYKGADWLEREVWDLYGVFFFKHNDLRRILTDYGFEGHPLRKDFPLTGFLEVYYDDSKKKIIYEPVSLAQEYRNYDFTNPWLLGKY